jgi:hypothetical protein
MKKLISGIVSMVLPMACLAVDPASVNRSSYVAGVTQSSCVLASYIDKVIVGEATTGGNVAFYSSSWTIVESQRISSVTLATVGMYDFANTQVRSGICYLADTPTNGFTILYKK